MMKKVNPALAAEEAKNPLAGTADDVASKFSYGKIGKFCKNGRFADRIGAGAPVYLAAVLQYLTEEIVTLAEAQMKKEQGHSKKKERITPRHIMLAIKSDPELAQLFAGGQFCSAGVMVTAQKPNKKKGMHDTDSEEDEDLSD